MRSAKVSTAATRRAQRPDGRLLRDMRKRHHGGRRGSKTVWIAGLILLAIVVTLAWHWLH